MRKVRKGFTLTELLIVIAIIGILSSMMMLAASEATDTAKMLKIAEGFKNVSAAMLTYDANTIDSNTKNAADILQGIKPYLKAQNSVTATDDDADGKYLIGVVADGSWWLAYKLNAADTAIGKKLAEKAEAWGFRSSFNSTENDYKGGQYIYVKVRS